MERKKKILYLSTKSARGGAQRYIIDLIDYLPPDRFDIMVAAGGRGPFASKVIERRIPYFEIRGLDRDISPFRDFSSFFQLIRLIRRVRPDIIHVNGSKVSVLGAIAGRILGVPRIISSTHGWPFLEERPTWQRSILRIAVRIGSLFQDSIICVSELDYEVALGEHIAEPPKFTQIHNGVDPKKHLFLERNEARQKLFAREDIIPKDYFIIGTIAEYTKNKGLYYLIEAVHNMINIQDNILVLLMGWGEEKEFLQKNIELHQLEKHIVLVDFLPEAFTYLKALDVFIFPSIKEGFAYALLEASLAELPIVATNVGGNPEIIENFKNGLLINPRSPQEIINAIAHLVRNPDVCINLGKAARKKVIEKFSIESMVRQTEELYLRQAP